MRQCQLHYITLHYITLHYITLHYILVNNPHNNNYLSIYHLRRNYGAVASFSCLVVALNFVC